MTGGNTCTVYIEGQGYSFESYRLGKARARDLQKVYEADPKVFTTGSLLGDEDPSENEIICDYIYGVDPLDMVCEWEDGQNLSSTFLKRQNVSRGDFLTDSFPQNALDYHRIRSGKVFGRIQLPLDSPSEFDPDLLHVSYFEFFLDGWPERYVRIISWIEYDGQEVEIDLEDNGLDTDHFLLGYEYNNGEFEDYVVIYESHGAEVITDFKWDNLDLIFR